MTNNILLWVAQLSGNSYNATAFLELNFTTMNDENTQGAQGAGDAAQNPPTPPTPPPATPPTPPAGGGVPTPPPPPAGGAQPPAGMPPMPPKEEDTTPANFQLGQLFTEGIKVKLLEHPETKFDENEFLVLLASSISLSKAEKTRIVDAIPKLKQWQIDELMNIFKEEKQKFAQLSKKHVPQLEKLAKQHYEECRDIEVGQEQEVKGGEDAAKAEEIRKNLGL